jgi:hypothetical protein
MDKQLKPREKPKEEALTLTHSSPSLITLILQSSQHPESALQLVERQAAITPALAMSAGEQLSVLGKQDKKVLLKALSMLITQLRQSLNVGKNLDTLQVYECAALLAEKYWYLRLEEFLYVFKQAKLGKYGKVYDRLDVQVISEWLHLYDTTERLAELERKWQLQQMTEADILLPDEEVQRCYQKWKSGEKLDSQLWEEERLREAGEERRKEVGFLKFRHEYFRNRQPEQEDMPAQEEGPTRDPT